MRRSWISIGAALCLMAACHSSDGPADPFVGHWLGTDPSVTLDLSLSGQGSGLHGSGTASGSSVVGGTIPLTINGTDDGSACHLTLSSAGYADVTLTGSLGHDSLYASLNGGGFSSYGVDLLRQ